MNWTAPTTLTVTCGRGCLGALRRELAALGHPGTRDFTPTAVGVEGDLREALKLNLWLRSANRVLFEVAAFRVRNPDELYAAASTLPWEEWLAPGAPFHLHGDAEAPGLRDPRFALLRCKDAIADRFVRKTGARPDSQSDPDGAACIALHWRDGVARLHLDTSGVPLSRRGYRLRPWIAPLRENLAASILLESGWDPAEDAFAGPMCGSGTLAIEAAWMAMRRAPGLHRESYAFQRLRDWPADAWRGLLDAARRRCLPMPAVPIAASDIDPRAVEIARDNAERAGMARHIAFSVRDFRRAEVPRAPGLVAMNPEYGERMGLEERLGPLYEAIGDDLKSRCAGLRAAVISGNPELAKRIGLRPSRRIPMWNGPIECRLLLYELYSGTRDPRLIRKHADPADA